MWAWSWLLCLYHFLVLYEFSFAAQNITVVAAGGVGYFQFDFNLRPWSSIGRSMVSATLHGPFDMTEICAYRRHSAALCRALPGSASVRRRSGRHQADVLAEVKYGLRGHGGHVTLRSPLRSGAIIPDIVLAWGSEVASNASVACGF